jgi:hypothetical protein
VPDTCVCAHNFSYGHPFCPDSKVYSNREQIKLAQEEISRVDTKVDMVDTAIRADLKEVDDRHTKSIKGACDRITICEEQGHELKQEIENMKETVMPRLNKLEEESAATQASLVSHGERYNNHLYFASQAILLLANALNFILLCKQIDHKRGIGTRNTHTIDIGGEIH